MYPYGPPHMAVQKQDDQHEHTFSSYVRIRDVVLKTYLGRWTIGRSGERGSGISVLPARYDDDLCYITAYYCSPMAQETGVQSPVKSYQRLKKWYLIPPFLTLSIIRYLSRVKWGNPGKRVAPPTHRCSSYWKWTLRFALDYGRQLYLLCNY